MNKIKSGAGHMNRMAIPGMLEDMRDNILSGNDAEPIRRQFNLIYLLLEGTHDVHLGAEHRWLKSNDLVLVPENFVYASFNLKKCKGYYLHFKTELVQPLIGSTISDDFPFFDLEAERIVSITAQQSLILQRCFKDLIREYHHSSPEQEELLRSFTHILLLRIRTIYHPFAKKIKESATSGLNLANRFKHLVEKNFIQIRAVNKYAAMLNVTTKYLSEVVKRIMGKSPRAVIKDMLLLESKMLLASTEKSITEIAYILNFSDQAHFSHFIKQHTGYTPHELQKRR
ncbi:helix-turn-helix domain-containing protein [Pedobacter nyackensis]|uniref:AraC family transcriptional regulator n=1 Tax=Pedobacter nyackensis TaxID=475255 RepID=UPI00292F6E84|nr:helix-turn-helix domain-containing protein [Pedobacter nyackensis]